MKERFFFVLFCLVFWLFFYFAISFTYRRFKTFFFRFSSYTLNCTDVIQSYTISCVVCDSQKKMHWKLKRLRCFILDWKQINVNRTRFALFLPSFSCYEWENENELIIIKNWVSSKGTCFSLAIHFIHNKKKTWQPHRVSESPICSEMSWIHKEIHSIQQRYRYTNTQTHASMYKCWPGSVYTERAYVLRHEQLELRCWENEIATHSDKHTVNMRNCLFGVVRVYAFGSCTLPHMHP